VSDPIELVDHWIQGFNARDEERVLAVAHPEIVLRPMRWVPRAEYRGHDGVREWLRDVAASANATTVTVDTVRLLSDGRVVVEGALDDQTARFVGLYAFRDARIVAVRAYLSDRELLEHLGILEPEAQMSRSNRAR
jgi:ketosteroid isomerase-like protein